jgi:Ca2+-binding RTX toxin-like protein
VVMDCDDVEIVRFEAGGGADIITVNNLAGTDVTEVRINLASAIGGNVGDGAADSIIVNGTAGDDVALIVGSPGSVSLLGLAASVTVSTSEVANDRITVNTLGGADVVEASGLASGVIALVADGGTEDDILVGSDGPDTFLGGDGDDTLIGNGGIDVLDGGTGDNTIIQ